MQGFSAKVNYAKDCLTADTRSEGILNVNGSKIEGLIRMEEEFLTTGLAPHHPLLDSKKAESLKQSAFIYQYERELLYMTLFLVGKSTRGASLITNLFAPIFTYPAEIFTENGTENIRIDLSQRRVNTALLLNVCESAELALKIAEDLSSFETEITERNLPHILSILEDGLKNLDVSPCYSYPTLFNGKIVPPKESFALFPLSYLGLVKKSQEVRGVLIELDSIAKNKLISEPLKLFLSDDSSKDNVDVNYRNFKDENYYTPTLLNNSQKKALYSVLKNISTVIVGPPGTGKSFTIASLAVDNLVREKSTLIVAKTDDAVDVIFEKILQVTGDNSFVVRAGRRNYLKGIKQYLDNLLHGITKSDSKGGDFSMNDLERVNTENQRIIRKIEYISKLEERWGKLFIKGSKANLMDKLNLGVTDFIIGNNPSLSELVQNLIDIQSRKLGIVREYVLTSYYSRLRSYIKKWRPELRNFLRGLRSRTFKKQLDLWDKLDFKRITKMFPIWLVKLNDLSEVLPLNLEMFDLVIFDEATQCDNATVLPALFRAKKSVFCGDPNQLRHFSFISRREESNLVKKHFGTEQSDDFFDYRSNSALDIASNRSETIFLNEHFRSVPEIINFSNEKFYSSAINIMTRRPNDRERNILLFKVKGAKLRKYGVNKEEADAVVDKLKELLALKSEHSIGIISPFRDQVEFISRLVKNQISFKDIERVKLIIATPYGFQGQERDYMLVSFAITEHSHPTALRYFERADVFNVAITRARFKQYIFISLEPDQLRTDGLLKEYLLYIDKYGERSDFTETTDLLDSFSKEVVEFLTKIGVTIYPAYTIASYPIDIVCEYKNSIKGIDLVGYPGFFSKAFTPERYSIFTRVGVPLFPLTYSSWIKDREGSEAKLKAFLTT